MNVETKAVCGWKKGKMFQRFKWFVWLDKQITEPSLSVLCT